MKKLLITILCFVISQSSFASNGDEVKNGGGIAEQYLFYALSSMPKNIDLCLAQTTCAEKPQQREILIRLKSTIQQEIMANILRFSSNAEKPGYFNIDGLVRLAVTGSEVGSTIYYNLDLLYNNGEVRMSYGQAVQSLIHELGHHQSIFDHDALELLGSEVRRSIEGTVSEVSFLPHLKESGFSALGTEAKSFDKNGALLLLFKNKAIDITPQFTKLLLRCDKDETGLDPILSHAIQFFNMHWKYNFKSIDTSGPHILTGNVILYCRHQYLKKYRKFYNFDLKVNVIYGKSFIYQNSQLMTEPQYVFTSIF